MNKKAYFIFYALLIGLFIARIIALVFYSDHVSNQIITKLIFILFGIFNIWEGLMNRKSLMRFVFVLCGIILIILSIIDLREASNIIGIMCLLTPLFFSLAKKRKDANQA